MAYVDATHTQRNVGTLAAVAVLETGLALAVIAGLSYNYTANRDTPMQTTEYTLPPVPEKKVDPPKPQPDTRKAINKPIDARDPVLVGTEPREFAGEDEGVGDGDGVGTAVFPIPQPSPAPSFSPVKAKPRGNPGNWVTENDYPTSEIRAEHQGRTGFRVTVDAAGKVSSCTVTASSGWPMLDSVTCEKLTRRAKFEAAIDSTGARTAGFYQGSVNWRLPED